MPKRDVTVQCTDLTGLRDPVDQSFTFTVDPPGTVFGDYAQNFFRFRQWSIRGVVFGPIIPD